MVDINYQNLPPQHRYKIDLSSLDTNVHKSDTMEVSTRVIETNDMLVTYIEGVPGQGGNWHNHDNHLDEIFLPIQGRLKVSAIDNDGSTHTTDVGPDELLYLPKGARNKMEIIGDERLKSYVIRPPVRITRPEQLIKGESDNYYNPHNIDDPEIGFNLSLDTQRGNVLHVDTDTTEPW